MLRWVLLLAACSQGLGDRCQSDSDCGDGLVCLLKDNPECPKSAPGCNACLVGGRCVEATFERDQTCISHGECGGGRRCQVSTSCARKGQRFCADQVDAGVPDSGRD
jgi:hypothetical protein